MKRLRILLVEDQAEVGELLSDFLAEPGHAVTVVRTLKEAVIELEREWDVVISDLRLPDGTGLDVGPRARARSPIATLIALTGSGAAGDITASRRAGFDHHLVKPVSLNRLRAVLNAATPPA